MLHDNKDERKKPSQPWTFEPTEGSEKNPIPLFDGRDIIALA
jgi:hypothetical protein